MSNFYKDNSDILFHMKNMDLSWVVDLKEDGFADKGKYSYAPEDYDDAIDNYGRVLEIVGEIAGEFVAPRSSAVDEESAQYKDGEVIYAKGTAEAIDRINKADLAGFTVPRKYDGINMPITIYSAAIEMISRADASFMNLFGLQGIADTITKFASEDQKRRYLPRFSSGEVMGSMALTEPDAGSDLQAVMLKATEGKDGKWHLNGVKRFITNGCAKISLVMARSEEGTKGGRGISLFIYERDENMKIRRIEHKLGIKGSPTCELQFNNAEAELLGKRKMGLIKYTMYLMNGARIAISAQAVGIAEAAYREADSYSRQRVQFKKAIRDFSAVYEMLTDMKVNIEAGRTLLYETSRIVDIKEGLEDKIDDHPESAGDLKGEFKRYSKYASLFTPIVKGYTCEMANKVCYDAIQIHAGVGFTCEFNVERHYRDVRITNIYEGTTQLQVVAAIGGVIGGVVFERLGEYEKNYDFQPVSDLFAIIREFRTQLESAVSHVKDKGDSNYQEFHAKRLVDMATDTILSYLLCIDAIKSERKKKVAQLFISKAKHRIESDLDYVLSNDDCYIELHKDIIDSEEIV
ncbi:MAG: acyl-CoA dehydrogenase [Desulfobacterales bacterium]|nr:acyl-CoA dehydrogenase [Desulfobacteraceae bacterium]MBT4363476.1 acyl-CoA dehydrogenase [Desulfobacteraceae bacterium]MBT7086173.1 acyl-CoA dehydrogenase [Desulfobacterales bacterium]MBT7698601.1 acyl-CoA dehydrogenase [Desulfobacterales bacterium]